MLLSTKQLTKLLLCFFLCLERGKELENSTNGKTEDAVVDQGADKAITVEAVIASDSLWSCLQAGIAQLLSLAPSEEHLRFVIIRDCITNTNDDQELIC